MGSTTAKVILVGLDNSGKTSILSKLQQPDRIFHNVTPTVGYQKHEISRNGVDIEIMDMSGDQKYIDLWVKSSDKINGIIFVVDSSDAMRLNLSQCEMQTLLEDPMLNKGIPILIYANKSDMKEAVGTQQIGKILKLQALGFPYVILKTSVITGQGIENGIKWLAGMMKNQIESKNS